MVTVRGVAWPITWPTRKSSKKLPLLVLSLLVLSLLVLSLVVLAIDLPVAGFRLHPAGAPSRNYGKGAMPRARRDTTPPLNLVINGRICTRPDHEHRRHPRSRHPTCDTGRPAHPSAVGARHPLGERARDAG